MVIRGATNRIICLNKSTSAPFSSNSFGLVIVVLPVQVRLLQTQPWPRTTMANVDEPPERQDTVSPLT
jgi:hypothetical protein